MIRSTLSVNDVDSCSDEDIGYSTNMMIFLDPKVNAKTGIVQYQSSLAVYEFQATTQADCMNNSNVAAYPITGGTVSNNWITNCLIVTCCVVVVCGLWCVRVSFLIHSDYTLRLIIVYTLVQL